MPATYPYAQFQKKLVGFNKGGGQTQEASLHDEPGGGIVNSDFEFETAVKSDDLGIYYGAVQWGFGYTPFSIYSEWFRFSPNPSDTFRSSAVEMSKFYKNRYVTEKNDNLAHVAWKFFRDASRAREVYEANASTLKTDDPLAAIAPGTGLDIPGFSPDKPAPGAKPGP